MLNHEGFSSYKIFHKSKRPSAGRPVCYTGGMQITILAVGRKLSAAAQTLADDYLKRLRPWAAVEVRLVASSQITSATAAVEDEGKRLLLAAPEDSYLIVLDEHGIQLTNEQLANRLAKVQEYIKHVVIVIGGAHGVSKEVQERAQFVWSLSPLVFPHELVRIILLEQLYRTYAILNRHPYHHR